MGFFHPDGFLFRPFESVAIRIMAAFLGAASGAIHAPKHCNIFGDLTVAIPKDSNRRADIPQSLPSAYHVETEERTYSEAVILKFWRTDAGLLSYSALTSQAFPVNILPLAQHLGEITVALSQKRASSAPFPAITPEVSSLRVAPHPFPSV